METRKPVDPTSTAAWQALAAHQMAMQPDLRGWFAADAGRVERMTCRWATCTWTCPRTS